MVDFLNVFSSIINVDMSLFLGGYNSSVNNWRKVEYHVFSEDIFSWYGPNHAVVIGPYCSLYICYGFTPWIYIVKDFVVNILGKNRVMYYLVQPLYRNVSMWVLYFHSYRFNIKSFTKGVKSSVNLVKPVCSEHDLGWESLGDWGVGTIKYSRNKDSVFGFNQRI